MNSRVTILLAGVILMSAGAPAMAHHLRAPDSVANQMVQASAGEHKKPVAPAETAVPAPKAAPVEASKADDKAKAADADEATENTATEATDDAATDMDTPVQDVEELKPE